MTACNCHSHSHLSPAPGMDAPVKEGDLAVVVGGGASGMAAVRLLAALGARVRLLERNETNIPDDFRALARLLHVELQHGEHTPAQFEGAALVVTSPGIPLSTLHPMIQMAGNPPLIAELELALRYVREPIIAVTGTSGKTTTVSLTAAMLEAGGKKVFLGGNIGTPLSDYVLRSSLDCGEAADVLVLEMSSFQLQGSEHLHPRVAVLLNLSPNHLDHHKNMEEYSEAKLRIFAQQDTDDLAIIPEDLLALYQSRNFKARFVIYGPTKRFSTTNLLGDHNAANAEAAFQAVREFGIAETDAARAVAEFHPLRHRLELAGEVDGVRFINDSKCTTVDAMQVALESFDDPIVLLAGGKFKGGDLTSLHPLLRRQVKSVVLFGDSREVFETAWSGIVPLFWMPELSQAFEKAHSLAGSGNIVLLSPATSSYDLYKNYMERGDHFCRLVKDLANDTAKDAL